MKTRHWNQQACVAVRSDWVSLTIKTAIQPYGIWPLPRNFRVYAEFREIPRKYGNSAATAKFRGSARNSAARGKLWALLITHYVTELSYSERPLSVWILYKLVLIIYSVRHKLAPIADFAAIFPPKICRNKIRYPNHTPIVNTVRQNCILCYFSEW